MIIKRNGKEIELTEQEMEKAYEIMREKYDMEFIKYHVSDFLCDEEEKLSDDESFLEDVVLAFREFVEKFNRDYDCLAEAVNACLEERE